MNKKFLSIFAVLAVAAVAAWNVNFNSQKSDLSDISLANVEALANDETSSLDGYLSCSVGMESLIGSPYRYCGSCKWDRIIRYGDGFCRVWQ